MAGDFDRDCDSERAKAVAKLAADNRRFRARAAYELCSGIGLVASLFIFGVIAEAMGVPHNNEAANRTVGLVAAGALLSFGLAAAHWCASLRRPAKTLIRPASGYVNPEDALAAAFQLDMHGDWDAAGALYDEVARRWPEHAQYAQGRITEIEEKRSRGSQP